MPPAKAAPARKRAAAKKPAPAPSDLFDLDAARAARAEAKGEPFPFTFGGADYEIQPATEWPILAVEHMADGHIRDALKILLGDQWASFAGQSATLGDLTDLFQALSAWQGMTPGE